MFRESLARPHFKINKANQYSMSMKKHQKPLYSSLMLFAIGGLSGALATVCIQPLDTLKVQVQVISERLGRSYSETLSISNIFARIKQEHGLQALYRGLDSAIFRQLFYASARLGAYETLVKKLEVLKERKVHMVQRAGISIISGAFGALVGNPFDVALIRRQASIQTGKHAYKNTFKALKTIIGQEGFFSMWRGLNITILRVVLINFGQLAGRDIISENIQFLQLAKQAHNTLVAMSASILTAVLSLPADNIKVKLQKQHKSQENYRGIWDCVVKSIGRQGVLRLWVGFPIYLVRGAPHSFILIRTQMYFSEKWQKLQSEL